MDATKPTRLAYVVDGSSTHKHPRFDVYYENNTPAECKSVEATQGRCVIPLRLATFFSKASVERTIRACNHHDELVAALREIAKTEGRFNRNQLIHAENTVQDMQALAVEALAKLEDS